MHVGRSSFASGWVRFISVPVLYRAMLFINFPICRPAELFERVHGVRELAVFFSDVNGLNLVAGSYFSVVVFVVFSLFPGHVWFLSFFEGQLSS